MVGNELSRFQILQNIAIFKMLKKKYATKINQKQEVEVKYEEE